MQSLVVYGRLLARAIVTGVHSEFPNQIPWHPHHRSHPRGLHLVSASSGISKTHSTAQVIKKWSFGDDACFIAGHKLADVLGVADGVGGWRTYGIDPSQFPSTFMLTCERLVKEGHFLPQNPVDILSSGYHEVLENKEALIGSCTACIVALHKEAKTIHTANLGDSGFRVVRRGKVVHRSEEQQHYFNTPFQLAVAPTVLQGVVLSDSPESAQTTSFGAEEGDVIVVGTDGLFDNMNDDMILKHIYNLKDNKYDSIKKTAQSIAHQAHELAFDPDYRSPFSISAAANGFNLAGGKPDDITVLLGKVTEGEDSVVRTFT